MRCAVVGGGALGSLLAASLARTDHAVTLLDHHADHVAAAREGLTVEGPAGDWTVPVPAATDAGGLAPVDCLLVAVKSYDTDAALRDAAPLVDDGTDLLTLQNGLGNAETLAEHADAERVVAGTTAHGATRLGPGRVRHAGRGPTRIGRYFAPNDDRVRAVADALTAGGVETAVVEHVRDAVWRKVAVNCGINAATALARVPNGALLEEAAGERVLLAAVEEAAAVARAAGRDVDGVAEEARAVARDTAENVSSMRADVEAGRRTEVEAINGAVAARGEERGVAVPVNRTLADLVRLAT